MKIRSILSLGIFAFVARSVTAFAASPEPGTWETTLSGGYDGMVRQTLADAQTQTLPDLGAIDPALGGNSATLTLNQLSFHDALHPGYDLAAESGYWMTENFEPFVRFDYARLRGRDTDIGTIASTALTARVPINGDFSNRDAKSLLVGGHYFFDSSTALRPFMTGFMGFAHQDRLHGELAATGVGLAPEEATLLHASTHFDAGFEAGLSYALSDHAAIRASAGVDYLEGGKSTTTALERFGLGPVELDAKHWSVPLNLGMSYRF